MITRVVSLVAAASLLAACGNGSTPTSPSPATTGRPTTAANLAAARAESQRLLTVLAPPPGGKVVTASPVADLRDQLEGVGPSDSRLSRHAWWTVPLTPTSFAAWLRAQHVPGMTVGDGGSSSAPDGTMVQILEVDGTSTSAYSAPVVTFAFVPDDGGVAVRLDTFLAARYARTAFLPADTTRVVVRQTTSRAMGPARRHVRRTVVADPARIARIVAAANRLDGIVTVPNVFHCPLILVVKDYTVVFTGPSGTFTVSGTSSVCGAVLTLRRGGRSVPPALDPGRAWFPMLDRVLRTA